MAQRVTFQILSALRHYRQPLNMCNVLKECDLGNVPDNCLFLPLKCKNSLANHKMVTVTHGNLCYFSTDGQSRKCGLPVSFVHGISCSKLSL